MSEQSPTRRAFLASTGLAAFAGPLLARTRSADAAAAAKAGAPAPAFSAVATTGRPTENASTIAIGSPSCSDIKTSASSLGMTVSRGPGTNPS